MVTDKTQEYAHLTEKERMIAGYPYILLDPELTAGRYRARELMRQYNQSRSDDIELRRSITKQLFKSGGDTVFLESPFNCEYGYNIELGENVFINFNCCILDSSHVKIGSNVFIAPNVGIYSATHPTDPLDRRVYELAKPITIGDDVWIGGGVQICPGVTIGDGVTVGAGSVISKDIPPFVIVAGNPARVIRELPGYEEYKLSKESKKYTDSLENKL